MSSPSIDKMDSWTLVGLTAGLRTDAGPWILRENLRRSRRARGITSTIESAVTLPGPLPLASEHLFGTCKAGAFVRPLKRPVRGAFRFEEEIYGRFRREQMKGSERQLQRMPQGPLPPQKTLATEPEPELYYLPLSPPAMLELFDRAEAHLFDESSACSPISPASTRNKDTYFCAQGDTPP